MGVRLALLLALGVASAGAAQSRVASPHDRLPVVPGAIDVVHEQVGRYPQVRFDVREVLPAPETIRQLVTAMSQRGWTLADLGTFQDAPPLDTPPPKWLGRFATHTWEGRWRDGKGREARFQLSYSCPLEQHGLHSVWVQVWGEVYGSQEAERRARERQQRSEEQQNLRDELCRAGALKESFCGK